MDALPARSGHLRGGGRQHENGTLLEELRPLPKSVWGKLRVTKFCAVVHGSTAVTNYVADEDKGYFGQTIHARYLATDTWLQSPDGWRLVATQVTALRDDPPAITLPASKLDDYVGVYTPLTPEVTYAIRRSSDGLTGERTGQQTRTTQGRGRGLSVRSRPTAASQDLQRDGAGRVTGFVERRETWDIVWRRRQ